MNNASKTTKAYQRALAYAKKRARGNFLIAEEFAECWMDGFIACNNAWRKKRTAEGKTGD
jgi:hypothetical protein